MGIDKLEQTIELLTETLRELHTELAWFQYNSAVVTGAGWCPHVSDAEELEADFPLAGLAFQGSPYDPAAVQAAIPKIVAARVGEVLKKIEARK